MTHYEALGLNKNYILSLGKEEALKAVDKAFRKKSLIWHPDKRKGKDKTDDEKKRATEEWGKIKKAVEELRKEFEKPDEPEDRREPCHNQCGNKCLNERTNPYFLSDNGIVTFREWEKIKKKWETTRGIGKSPFFFCSQNCLKQFKNNFLFRCQKCRDTLWISARVNKIEKNGSVYCEQCAEGEIPKPPEENNKKPHPTGGECAGFLDFCTGNKSPEWKKGIGEKKKHKWYCQYCWNKLFKGNSLQGEIAQVLADISDALKDYPPVSLNELDGVSISFYYKLKSGEGFSEVSEIQSACNTILICISKKRAAKKNEDHSDPLTKYKINAIIDIEEAMLATPALKIEELDSVNRDYDSDIKAVGTKEQIDAIKSRVLANIQRIREEKTKDQTPTEILENLRTEAINLIYQELKRKPKISENDISNPNWETDLENANDRVLIIEMRDKVLAEIKSKRAAQLTTNKVVELLERAKTANTFEALAWIITELKNYVSAEVYQQHQEEINALEVRLQNLDPNQYQKKVETDLEKTIQDQGLTFSELSANTQRTIEQAKHSGQPVDKNLAEAEIVHEGAQINLNKLLDKASAALTKSQLEKEQLAAEIENFISKDPIKKAIYQKNRSRVDFLLSQLRGSKQQEQIPNTPKSTWPKTLGMGALIVVPLALVGGVILYQGRAKQRRRK